MPPPGCGDVSGTMPAITTVPACPAVQAAPPHNRIRAGYARVSTRSQDHQSPAGPPPWPPHISSSPTFLIVKLVPLIAALPPTLSSPFTQSAHGARPAMLGMPTTLAWIVRCAFVWVSVLSLVGVQPIEVICRTSGSPPGSLMTVTRKTSR